MLNLCIWWLTNLCMCLGRRRDFQTSPEEASVLSKLGTAVTNCGSLLKDLGINSNRLKVVCLAAKGECPPSYTSAVALSGALLQHVHHRRCYQLCRHTTQLAWCAHARHVAQASKQPLMPPLGAPAHTPTPQTLKPSKAVLPTLNNKFYLRARMDQAGWLCHCPQQAGARGNQS